MIPGRLIFPALRWHEDSGWVHEQAVIDDALRFGAGGFILFGGRADDTRQLTAQLRAAAGRPLLIASDLERGAGQQIRGLSELPPPLALAALEEPAVLRGAGLLTAVEALDVGINWVLAPVADLDIEPENPIVQSRAFGADPVRVADAVAAWVAGCEGGGALACAKHFPGHGRTRADSHDTLPRVDATGDLLRGADLVPFRAAVAAGVSTVMTAHVAFPALDPSGAAATFSPSILALLRRELGFGGLVVSDALMMEGARAGRSVGAAAVAAVAAGVDLLLYPDPPAEAATALADAVRRDPALAGAVEQALGRYQAALDALAGPVMAVETPAGSALALADWLLRRPMLRGQAPTLRRPLGLTVVDDDVGGIWPPSSPPDVVTRELQARGVPLGAGGSRVAMVLAEPRGFKGRAGLGTGSLEALGAATVRDADLIVLFGHPRLLNQLPEGPPVLLAWHRQALMQQAAARWLGTRLT